MPLPSFPLPSTSRKTLASQLFLSELAPTRGCHADPALSTPLPFDSPVASCLVYQVSGVLSITEGLFHQTRSGPLPLLHSSLSFAQSQPDPVGWAPALPFQVSDGHFLTSIPGVNIFCLTLCCRLGCGVILLSFLFNMVFSFLPRRMCGEIQI